MTLDLELLKTNSQANNKYICLTKDSYLKKMKKYLADFFRSKMEMPEEVLMQICNHFEEKKIEKNGMFLEMGKMSNEYAFLVDGYMRAYTFNTEGEEITTNIYCPKEMVIEPLSFFRRIPAKENIQSISDCVYYSINFETINQLFHSMPAFRELGRSMLVGQLVEQKFRSLSLINEKAEQRYQNLLQQKREMFQHVPLKYIASYLGITDTSFSRIRREHSRK